MYGLDLQLPRTSSTSEKELGQSNRSLRAFGQSSNYRLRMIIKDPRCWFHQTYPAPNVARHQNFGKRNEWIDPSCLEFCNLKKHVQSQIFTTQDRYARRYRWSFRLGWLQRLHQIKMDSSDVEKTTFRTPMGNFHCTVMLFGLNNTGATYQRADYYLSLYAPGLSRKLCRWRRCKVLRKVPSCRRFEESLYLIRPYNLRMNPLKCDLVSLQENFWVSLSTERRNQSQPRRSQSHPRYRTHCDLQTVK